MNTCLVKTSDFFINFIKYLHRDISFKIYTIEYVTDIDIRPKPYLIKFLRTRAHRGRGYTTGISYTDLYFFLRLHKQYPADILRNNDVVITPKRRHFAVITSK